MMNKKIVVLTLLLLLSVVMVQAAPKWDANLLDRQIMNVKNCFNLTVHYELTDGVGVPVYFSGCTDKGDGTWFCNCREDDNSYTLVMRTDKTMVRDAREYDIDVEGYLYSFYRDDVSFRVLDWGDYTDIKGSKVNDLGKDGEGECSNADPEIIEVEKIVYVNQTIEVPKEVVKEVQIVDNGKILSLNNRITELEANNTQCTENLAIANEKSGVGAITWICLIGLMFTTGYIIYKKMGF